MRRDRGDARAASPSCCTASSAASSRCRRCGSPCRRSAAASMKTWHTPSRCLMTGTRASRAMRSMRLLPPRGTMTSTCFSSAMRWPTAARSVVATTCTACSGRPAVAQAVVHAGGDGGVAADRLGAAAQDRRVARLEAQPRGIRGHVRTRFVDDADDAERHAHATDLDTGGAVAQDRDLAHRVGQRGDFARPSAMASGLRRQREPVDERVALALARAASTSSLFAARRRPSSRRIAVAIACSARFFALVRRAHTRAPPRARLAHAAHVRGHVEARHVQVRHAVIVASVGPSTRPADMSGGVRARYWAATAERRCPARLPTSPPARTCGRPACARLPA